MLLLISIKCQAIEVYYTDFHGVDEDSMTIVDHGGDWTPNLWAGVMYRDVLHSPSYHADYVASRLIYLS